MCLGVPGRVVTKYQRDGLPMGKVDFGGTQREACLAYVPEAEVGAYVLVHVGFAISALSEEEAHKTLSMLNEIMDIGEELGPEALSISSNLSE